MHENNHDRDYRAILEIINLYSLAIDTQNWDLFDEIFTHDIVADYPGKTWTNLTSWKRDFAALHLPYEATQHQQDIMQLKFQEHEARAITYGQWLLVRKLGDPPSAEWRGQGWYEDEIIRTAKGWRIRKRINRMISSVGSLNRPEDTHPVEGIYRSSLKAEYEAGGLASLRVV